MLVSLETDRCAGMDLRMVARCPGELLMQNLWCPFFVGDTQVVRCYDDDLSDDVDVGSVEGDEDHRSGCVGDGCRNWVPD